ncbi:hypothetical protein KR51_00026090 [Rubidibacter lacunae KORDI 51-2]|uniref:Glycosyltransferase RgtA/B/C/D-like domain-containing protein n=1 Tax=Rubidibacter lacunae KORDI 51-2 TaxID=582515 RepID=U5DH22_9CHRO|nr:glycosyltransferase family 39 protein [Rubidibacter lacunae]ERN40896.1 hypothetical protein KR51_00026090 [Rubidibacter lacunae KORDI 51-2]
MDFRTPGQRPAQSNGWLHALRDRATVLAAEPWLWIWTAVALVVRVVGLAAKPAWRDELATTVFGLGNSFLDVPLNRAIAVPELLQPLASGGSWGSVLQNLFAESTHPPLFFLLVHGWMQIFAPEGGWPALTAARSLSALLGALSVPALYVLMRMAGTRRMALIAAMLMALSPFGIFLAREARHYTLAELLAIASLACGLRAVQAIAGRRQFSIAIALLWTAVNALGMATHFFFAFVLGAQVPMLLGTMWAVRSRWSRFPWQALLVAIGGSIAGAIVWLPVLGDISGSSPTQWIYDGDPQEDWLQPLARLLMWNLSQVTLLPTAVTAQVPVPVAIASGGLMVGFALWALPRVVWGWRHCPQQLELKALSGYFLSAIALFLGCTYGLELDLTLASRFQYVYFPAAIALVAVAVATCWRVPVAAPVARSARFAVRPDYRTVIAFGLAGTFGAMTVIANAGYLQTPRPDLLARTIAAAEAESDRAVGPVTIATIHLHHGQTGTMMALAREFDRAEVDFSVEYFLAHRDRAAGAARDTAAIAALRSEIATRARPFDLWSIGRRFRFDLGAEGCDRQLRGDLGEYNYRLYRCTDDQSSERANRVRTAHGKAFNQSSG